ncbi:class I SAM-dependent methyltransferase [Pseudochryseolinea flava]|nr:class I SAM-dependent methyltransferase [Pseudochryseolinea flava]
MELQQFSHSYDSLIEGFSETSSQNRMLEDFTERLQRLIAKGGPDRSDYNVLDDLMINLHQAVKEGDLMPHELDSLKKCFHTEFLEETVHGYAYRKPLGYAGDYLLIDKIYTFYKTSHRRYKKWDQYFHALRATQAVRNRKDYFKAQMLATLQTQRSSMTLLNVASGPARDLFELYQEIDPQRLQTTCIDVDARALSFAQELCRDYASQTTFCNKNVLRFSTQDKFDVIWSAGLFDYFEDKIFVLALKRFMSWLKPGGEIIIGNFSEDNTDRGYMEIFGDWILIHRSKEELIRLSLLAGAKEECIVVDQEPLGINLFLKIKG